MKLKEKVKETEKKLEEKAINTEKKLEKKAKGAEKKLEEEAKTHPLMFFWDPVFIYTLIIFRISDMHFPPYPEAYIGLVLSDSIKHVLLYFGFSLTLGIACRHSKFKVIRENHYLLALLGSITIGALDEIHQLDVWGRHMRIEEIGLNAVGCVIGQIARFLLRLEKRLLHKIF
jgi:VanZ family protein